MREILNKKWVTPVGFSGFYPTDQPYIRPIPNPVMGWVSTPQTQFNPTHGAAYLYTFFFRFMDVRQSSWSDRCCRALRQRRLRPPAPDSGSYRAHRFSLWYEYGRNSTGCLREEHGIPSKRSDSITNNASNNGSAMDAIAEADIYLKGIDQSYLCALDYLDDKPLLHPSPNFKRHTPILG